MANDGSNSSNSDNEPTSATSAALSPPEHTTLTPTPNRVGATAHQSHTTDAENSFAMIISVWWSFSWRFVLLFLAASFLFGIVITFAVGGDIVMAERWGGYFTLIVTIPISIWSMGKALTRTHKKHRIIFIEHDPIE